MTPMYLNSLLGLLTSAEGYNAINQVQKSYPSCQQFSLVCVRKVCRWKVLKHSYAISVISIKFEEVEYFMNLFAKRMVAWAGIYRKK